MERDLVHSDLPLFGQGGENEWPQHFATDDSFGCTSRVRFGDWVFRETGAEQDENALWLRFTSGAFHCRERIVFILLDTVEVDGSELELWAVQIADRAGSNYWLLSRAPADALIESFAVLQTACPDSQVPEGGALNTPVTRYCAINSRAELTALARRMAQRPQLGTVTRVAGAGTEASE
jgi:hypothetical protein